MQGFQFLDTGSDKYFAYFVKLCNRKTCSEREIQPRRLNMRNNNEKMILTCFLRDSLPKNKMPVIIYSTPVIPNLYDLLSTKQKIFWRSLGTKHQIGAHWFPLFGHRTTDNVFFCLLHLKVLNNTKVNKWPNFNLGVNIPFYFIYEVPL